MWLLFELFSAAWDVGPHCAAIDNWDSGKDESGEGELDIVWSDGGAEEAEAKRGKQKNAVRGWWVVVGNDNDITFEE
jgi:hypothetical protein